jgi:hypothetical protein
MRTLQFIAILTISLFLANGPAGAQTVVFGDSLDPTKATSITDLEVGGTSYNVVFEVSTFAFLVYGPFPGTFNIFNTVSQAEVAVDSVNSALNSWGATSIGNINTPGIEFFTYNIGYDTFLVGSIQMIHTWRAAKPDINDPWVSTGQNQWTYNTDERNWAVFTISTGVDDHHGTDFLKTYELFPNYPNPFNPTTTITYHVPRPTKVTLRIFDIRGQLVRTLVDGVQGHGQNSVVWDGRNNTGQQVASGVYLSRLNAGGISQTRKMMLMK